MQYHVFLQHDQGINEFETFKHRSSTETTKPFVPEILTEIPVR